MLTDAIQAINLILQKMVGGGEGRFYAYQNTFIFRGNSFIDTLRNPSIQPCFTEDNNQSLKTQSSSHKCLIFHQNPD